MFISAATLLLVSKLATVGAAGLAAVMGFVVITVDRMNVRLAELEARLAARDAAPAPVPAHLGVCPTRTERILRLDTRGRALAEPRHA